MFRLRWLQVGGATRGMPRRDRAHRKHWPILGLLACLSLVQSGCQSGMSSGGGLCGPCGFFNRVSARVFNRSNGCCSPAVGCDSSVESVAPAAIVTPGVVVTPTVPVVPGSSLAPSSVAPLPTEPPTDLNPATEPAPKSRVNGGSSSSSLPSNKTSYQTRRQDPSSRLARRPVTMPRTTVSTPVPTSRSAQVLSGSTADSAREADDQDPLDHLPPLDLPGEVTKSAAMPPVPPAVRRNDTPGSEPEGKAAVKREVPAPRRTISI